MEILIEGAPENGFVAVGGESTGEDRDVAKGRFQGLIKDIGHFVFKVLGCDEGVQEFSTIFAQHSVDFTTSSAQVLFIVECEPEFVDTVRSRPCSGIQENADFRL